MQHDSVFIAYGEFTDPKTGRNFIVCRIPGYESTKRGRRGYTWQQTMRALEQVIKTEICGLKRHESPPYFNIDGHDGSTGSKGRLWTTKSGARGFQWDGATWTERSPEDRQKDVSENSH